MDKNIIQQTINELYYWDAAVKSLECNCFADEVTLVYANEDGDVTYRFINCYKVVFDHYIGYAKNIPVRKLSFAQIPYFLQNVEISEIEIEQEQKLYSCKLLLPPLEVIIWCKDIMVSRS